jgi:23S rRNA (pseudouridine1915-N3)-methyltransferase
MTRGTRSLTFAIGGADGLPPALVARAGLRLSLSPLTLPHRLARLILSEQIYRALTIIRHEPYHH